MIILPMPTMSGLLLVWCAHAIGKGKCDDKGEIVGNSHEVETPLTTPVARYNFAAVRSSPAGIAETLALVVANLPEGTTVSSP